MDIQTTDIDPDLHDHPDASLAEDLLDALPAPRPAAAAATQRRISAGLFKAMAPANDADAAMATLAIAAFHSALDKFARAAQSGMTDDQAMRLTSSALGASRFYAATLRTLRKQQAEAAPQPAPKPVAKPAPKQPSAPPEPEAEAEQPADFQWPDPEPQFQPRDKHGEPIPLHACQLMTMAQRRAAFCDPLDADYADKCAEAIAEEEAAIAAAAAQPQPG